MRVAALGVVWLLLPVVLLEVQTMLVALKVFDLGLGGL